MPKTIPALPDTPQPAGTSTTPAGGGWVDAAWAELDAVVTHDWFMYGLAGLLALLLALSLRSRRKRTKLETEGKKAELTRTDLAVTRITGILATAVVATGAWKVFGDVLHLHPAIRLVLFFFAEAQIVAAWRRVRRHIHRHATLGPGVRTIYGIAFGSALVAAFDADNFVEVLLRFFAAGVAAYMIAEELAEELDIYLTAHPQKRTSGTARVRGRIKWAFNLERILVWLRLAEPTERTVEEVERQRRVARFARTAYRLHVLKENEAKKWRIRLAQWQLRRQTESGNEHLNLAGDEKALADVRAQLALLYGAEAGTSRTAVDDLNPLAPRTRLAITAKPHQAERPTADCSQQARTGPINGFAPAFSAGTLNGSQPAAQSANGAAKVNGSHPANLIEKQPAKTAGKPVERPAAKPAAGAKVLVHPLAGDPNDSIKALAKAYARKPLGTNAELAKLAKVSVGTANRYMPQIRAAAVDSANADADEERAQSPLTGMPTNGAKTLALAGVGAHPIDPQEN
jgi:hypothetical protein